MKEAGTGWEETPDGYGEDYGRVTRRPGIAATARSAAAAM